MCVSCVTTAEGLLFSGGGLVLGLRAVALRRRPRRRAADRRRDTAAFLAALGLDPEAVLGPEPAHDGDGSSPAVPGRAGRPSQRDSCSTT